MLVKHVLERLEPIDCAMLAQVGKPWLAVVVANNLPRAGKSVGLPLKLVDFVGSEKRLAWAKSNGCPWTERTCAFVAAGGQLGVLSWARDHGCPWHMRRPHDAAEPDVSVGTCASAALNGHLEVLRWARENGCPWNMWTCARAAEGGHLEVLQWAREHGCPWGRTCTSAARGGHLIVLAWARQNGCPCNETTLCCRR